MTENLQHKPHAQVQPNSRRDRQTRLRDDAESMLRDLAFVLRMTKKVRDEMETENEVEEAISV